jgi:lysozyme
MTDLKMGADGLAVVKAFESCMQAIKARPGYFAAYVDPVGVLTIGWGHTNDHLPKFTSATVWSQADCDAALAGDMATFEKHVNGLAKVDLKQWEFDALVSWAFNTGGPSTASLWTALNSGNKAVIPAKLAEWNKGTVKGQKVVLSGLTRRRKAEGLLFQGRIAEAYDVAEIKPLPRPVAPIVTISGKPVVTITLPPPPVTPAAKPSIWASIFSVFRKA